jgi:hypothetical protein
MDVAGFTEALVEVRAPQFLVPALPNATSLEPAPGLELLGYEVRERDAQGQAWVRLRLWWRAPGGLRGNLKVSARLVDANDQLAAFIDGEPVAWTYPTTAWRPGEIVSDAYEIPLPAGLAPGFYRPLIIVYDPVSGTERGRAELPATPLRGRPARPTLRELKSSLGKLVRARFGEVELLGYSLPNLEQGVRPGQVVPLTLLWEAQRRPGSDVRLQVRVGAGSDAVMAEDAVGGEFPTIRWDEGQVVRQVIPLHVPDDLLADELRIDLRLIRDGRPVPWSRGVLPGGSDLELVVVRIIR